MQQRRGIARIPGVDRRLGGLNRQVIHDLHRAGQEPGGHEARDGVARGFERRVRRQHRPVASGLGIRRSVIVSATPKSPSDPMKPPSRSGPTASRLRPPSDTTVPSGEHGPQPQHVVERHAVPEAVRSAGIEGDVAANRADRLARRIGRVVEPEARRGRGDVEIDDARLHDGHPIDRVHLEDAIEAVEGDDDAVGEGHGAAGQARAAAAGDEGHAGQMAQPDGLDDLVGRGREHDRARASVERGQPVGLEGRERARRGDQPGRRQEAGERRQELDLSHRAMVMGIGARRHGVDYTGRPTHRAPELS